MDTALRQYFNLLNALWEKAVCLCGKYSTSAVGMESGTEGSYKNARFFSNKNNITYNATQAYNKIIEDFTADFTAKYIAQCLPENDLFKYDYIESEYHYTLYYYDQAGNLVQTVPPEGVHLLDIATNFNSDGVWNGTNPVHTYKSEYDYNSLNQPVRQQTPDGGIARSWYNKKGQLMASQNAKQAATTYTDDALVQYKPYSYTRYDELGRTVESGELNVKKTQSLAEVSEAQQEALVNHAEFPNSATINGVNEWQLLITKPKVQVTKTYYDETLTASVNGAFGVNGQENLRSRAASATFEEKDDNNDATYDHASHYSYDPLGNVKTLLQENSALKNVGHDFKRLDYEYDLVSGNVNEVKYQHGQPDRFYHQYDYDADNRIIQAITSSDKMIYDRDAKYFYYKHGPLARTETGHDKVQGCDYAYTVQGWIKGMNSNTLKANRDIGKDAILSGKNAFTGTDALGYTIGYFNNDYSPIATITAANYFEAGSKTSAFSSTYNLFNGNISHVIPAMMKPDETYLDILGNDYRYDQLNRLKAMEEYSVSGLRTSNSWSGAMALTDYKVNLSYDANGNITSLFRNAVGAMDDMTYSYVPNTNKLNYVSDAVASSNYATDIDNQSANNYDYDPTGNLIKDEQEEIASIEWTVYGKVKKITRDAGSVKPDLEFGYDATGNRISKTVKPRTADGLTDATEWTTTFYTRDAQGNIMAMYENNFVEVGPAGEYGTLYKEQLRLKEMPIYGSKRVGVKNNNLLLDERNFTANISSITKEFINVIEADPQDYVSPGLSSICGAGERGKGVIQLSGPNVSYAELNVAFFVNGVAINQAINWQGPTFTATALANAINSFISSPDYVAEANNDEVIIYTVTETDDHNNFVISGVKVPDWDYTIISNMQGGKDPIPCERVMGRKTYELTNLLGSVHVVVSDKKIGVDPDQDGAIDFYTADVLYSVDRFPFGSPMPGRTFNPTEYRFGNNGQEKVDEISGSGNHYTAEFWEYDSRTGRRWENDLIAYPWQSPYACFNNNPIYFADPLGLQGEDKNKNVVESGQVTAPAGSKVEFSQGDITKQTFEMKEFEVCGNCISGEGQTASMPSDNTSASTPYQATQPMDEFKESMKITGMNRLTKFGSDEAFINTVLNSRVMSQEGKSYYFNMRVTQGPARQAGAIIAGTIVSAATSGALGYLAGAGSRLLGTAIADEMGIGSTYRHWGTAELQFSLGTNAYKYSGLANPTSYQFTTPMLTNSSRVVYNRLALNYTLAHGGRNPMLSSYYISQIEIRGFYLSGVIGRQGSTLGSGIQYTPLNVAFRQGLAGVTR